MQPLLSSHRGRPPVEMNQIVVDADFAQLIDQKRAVLNPLLLTEGCGLKQRWFYRPQGNGEDGHRKAVTSASGDPGLEQLMPWWCWSWREDGQGLVLRNESDALNQPDALEPPLGVGSARPAVLACWLLCRS